MEGRPEPKQRQSIMIGLSRHELAWFLFGQNCCCYGSFFGSQNLSLLYCTLLFSNKSEVIVLPTNCKLTAFIGGAN